MSTWAAERANVTIPDLNMRFLALLMMLGGGLTVAVITDVEPRLLSTLIGSAALGGLIYRLITTWEDCPVLVHVLALLLAGFLLVAALAQMQLSGAGPGGFARPVPLTIAVWPGVALRVAACVVVLFWPRWANQRTSPFRNE